MRFLLSIFLLPIIFFQIQPSILYPSSGDLLQGLVNIVGSTNVDGFISNDISFSYANDTTGTWFLIAYSTHIVNDEILCEWDTTLVTDGNYDLRLRIFLRDGTVSETIVEDLRIRNYQVIETPIIIPSPQNQWSYTEIPAPSIMFSTSILISSNPMEISENQLFSSLEIGVGVVVMLLILSMIYIRFRWK